MKTLILIMSLVNGGEIGKIVISHEVSADLCEILRESVTGYTHPNAPIIIEPICADAVIYEERYDVIPDEILTSFDRIPWVDVWQK